MTIKFQTHGGVDWCEYLTRDVESSLKFYTEVLGWDIEAQEMEGGGTYYTIKVNGEGIGGMMKMPEGVPAMIPAHWGIYITVDDVDEVVRKAKESGGSVLVPPTDVPEVGRFATIQDNQQGVFNVMTYKMEE